MFPGRWDEHFGYFRPRRRVSPHGGRAAERAGPGRRGLWLKRRLRRSFRRVGECVGSRRGWRGADAARAVDPLGAGFRGRHRRRRGTAPPAAERDPEGVELWCGRVAGGGGGVGGGGSGGLGRPVKTECVQCGPGVRDVRAFACSGRRGRSGQLNGAPGFLGPHTARITARTTIEDGRISIGGGWRARGHAGPQQIIQLAPERVRLPKNATGPGTSPPPGTFHGGPAPGVFSALDFPRRTSPALPPHPTPR